jgi:hypothetical protein
MPFIEALRQLSFQVGMTKAYLAFKLTLLTITVYFNFFVYSYYLLPHIHVIKYYRFCDQLFIALMWTVLF